MTRTPAYFDSSVLVKRYVDEVGSVEARRRLDEHHTACSAVAPVEVTSALKRRREAGQLSERRLRALLDDLRQDRAHWELVEVSGAVLDRAEAIVVRAAVKTIDAIHLASALLLAETTVDRLPFVTADARQREVAARVGLPVVWVG